MNALITYQELSKILKVSEPTLRRWVMNRQIQFSKIGKCVRFTPEDVAAIIADSKREVAQ